MSMLFSTTIIRNSVRQSEILELLAKTRGATAEQVTRALYNDIDVSKLTQSYALLYKLMDKKLIEYQYYQMGDKQKRLYYLSKKGLFYFHQHHFIFEDYQGTGLFNDFGYFSHTLYKPKHNQIIHFLMNVDAMIDVYLLKKETNLDIDFANNLYCATKSVRPDFMFQFQEDKYFVEIDRMNERGVALNKKFEKYNDYFRQTDTSEVKGIVFIVPTPKSEKMDQFNSKQQQRYESVVKAYFSTCEEYKKTIDLVFLNQKEFAIFLNQKFKNTNQHKPQMVEYLKQQAPQKVSVINEEIYLSMEENKVKNLNVRIEYRSTKIWYDLMYIQKQYSEKIKNEGILEFEDYKYIPDVNILTTKKNLNTIIQEEEYPLLINSVTSLYKVPKIIVLE